MSNIALVTRRHPFARLYDANLTAGVLLTQKPSTTEPAGLIKTVDNWLTLGVAGVGSNDQTVVTAVWAVRPSGGSYLREACLAVLTWSLGNIVGPSGTILDANERFGYTYTVDNQGTSDYIARIPVAVENTPAEDQMALFECPVKGGMALVDLKVGTATSGNALVTQR